MRIDHERLVLARNLRDMTQKDLSSHAKISQTRISRLEHGVWLPTADEIEAFAVSIEAALSLPYGFLAKRGPNRPMPYHFFRKKRSLSARDEKWLSSVVQLASDGIHSMSEFIGIESPFPLPELEVDQDSRLNTGAAVARRVREALGLRRGPISDIVKVIESTGVVVVPVYGTSSKFDGVAVPSTDGRPNIIFYNVERPGDRIRFTLAHEFGHLVMHRRYSDTCEDEANLFGAEFLMPASEIGPQLRGLDLFKASQLKPIWGCSIASLVVRAKTLHAISENRFRSLYVMLSQKGWRTEEPGDVDFNQFGIFQEMVRICVQELGVVDVEGFFAMGSLEFGSVFGIPLERRSSLRLV